MFSLAPGLMPTRKETGEGGFPQRRMRVLLAEEGAVDARQAELQASFFPVEQGNLTYQGDH